VKVETHPRVLIVDDNQALSSTLKEIMEEEGCAVSVAYDALNALTMVREIPFNVAIVDIKLPGMQGDELVSEIHEIHPELPCIFITGNASIESAIAAVNLDGVVGYELKPLDIDRILTLIRQVIARQVAEEKARIAASDLEKALSERREFLSMVSHELRSPLVPIVGYTEMLLSGDYGELPDSMNEPIKAINSSAEKMRVLIDDLKLVNTLDSSRINLEITDVDVSALIDDLLFVYNASDEGKSVQFSREGDEIVVRADKSRLRQVIENLISNAVKYSGDSVNITIKSARSDDRGIISIIDNGIGIPYQHLQNIFKRFYRVEMEYGTTQPGSGLGLAIVKEFTENMGGMVDVSSEVGKGSTFTLSLPLAGKVGKSDRPETQPESVSDEKKSIPVPTKVLIIDDDPFTCELVGQMLKGTCEVIEASSGANGLEILSEQPVDMILLDWMMPKMDGLTVLKSLKSDASTENIPVIFISGKADPDSIELCMLAGAADFIIKPFKRADLIEKILKNYNPD